MLEKLGFCEQLARAEGHVSLTERHIQEQEKRIALGVRRGWDTAASRDLLETFRETLRLHVEGRDRLREELAALVT